MFTRALFLIGLGATLATPAMSQHHHGPQGPRGQAGEPRAIPIEAALRHRETLKLTERQVTELSALREETVKARQQHMAATMELSSRYRAGELSRDEFRSRMQTQRQATAPGGPKQADKLQGILDQTQRAALRDLVMADRQEMRRGAGRQNMMQQNMMGGRRGHSW